LVNNCLNGVTGAAHLSSSHDMGDELVTLADKIKKTEEKIEKLEKHIDTIRTGDDDAVQALVKQLRFKDDDEALESLRAKEAELNERLNTYEKQKLATLTQQQQQSSAGTSMLPVRQELVMCPGQRSCLVHQQALQLSECVFVACAFDPQQMHRYHSACHRCRCLI
jgi:hypothetical protein